MDHVLHGSVGLHACDVPARSGCWISDANPLLRLRREYACRLLQSHPCAPCGAISVTIATVSMRNRPYTKWDTRRDTLHRPSVALLACSGRWTGNPMERRWRPCCSDPVVAPGLGDRRSQPAGVWWWPHTVWILVALAESTWAVVDGEAMGMYIGSWSVSMPSVACGWWTALGWQSWHFAPANRGNEYVLDQWAHCHVALSMQQYLDAPIGWPSM